MENRRRHDNTRLLLFYRGRLYVLNQTDTTPGLCQDPCNPQLDAMVSTLDLALRSGWIRISDSLLVLTAEDNKQRVCRPGHGCRLPQFGISKAADAEIGQVGGRGRPGRRGAQRLAGGAGPVRGVACAEEWKGGCRAPGT